MSTKHERNGNRGRSILEVSAEMIGDGVKGALGFLSAHVKSPRMTAGQTATGSATKPSSSIRQRRRRPKPCSDGDRELSPLEQAKEIQNQGYGSGNSNSNRRREHHKRPPPVSRPSFSSPSSRNRGTNKNHRNTNHTPNNNTVDTRDQSREKSSHMVDLCSSNSDTDYDSDNKRGSKESPSALSPRAHKIGTRSGGSKPESAGKRRRKAIKNERKRQQPSSVPKYPSNGDGDGDGDGNGDGHGGKSHKRNKKRGESQAESEAIAGSSFDLVEEHNSKSNQETIGFETNSGSWIDETEERIPRKKPPLTQSFLERNTMKIPVLKQIRTRTAYGSREKKQRKRARHYNDVKDMDCSIEKDNDDNDCAKAATPYLTDMKNVIEVAESCANGIDVDVDIDNYNDNDSDKVHSVVSTPRTTTNSSPSSSFMKNMKKVNNKGARAKTKVRKPSKIVPGASLMQRNNQQQHWRSEKDQDEYHTSNKETQDEVALGWDPVNGGRYRNTRSSTTRHNNQYGSSPGLSEHDTDWLPRRRSSRKNKQKKPETIDILSSDSEDDVVIAEEEESNVFKWPLKRLAVGEKKVYNNQDHQPMVIYNDEKCTMEITYFKSKVVQNVREKIDIDITDIEEISKWAADDAVVGLDAELDSFIFLRADVSVKYRRKRKAIAKKSQKLVLEFEQDLHMNDLDANLSDCPQIIIYAVSPGDVGDLASSLIADSKEKYNLRSTVMPHETDAFISNRRSDEILLVYPFGVDQVKTEAAADGLKELSWSETSQGENQDSVESKNENKMDSATSSSENALTTMQSGQRSHFIEIRVEDYEKLDTGQWLNDSLVDMWMQWTSRHIACKRSSNFHFFTSHFYTTLASSEGVKEVSSWTAKKNINIFEKKLIFIPINKTLHWSLCVVVNPGAITSSASASASVDDDDDNDWKDQPLPCILFFDSLNMHRKARVHRDVSKWLNAEWQRMKGSDLKPFNKKSWKIYDPQVPRQNNGSDCGVFVCRYAFAMFQLRHRKFSRRDAGLEKDYEQRSSRRQRNAPRSQPFSDLITNGKEFDFNVEDIQCIRSEFKTLIRNLHPMYQVVKDDKIKAEKEEKKARKKRKEKATETTQNATTQKSSELVQCDLVETPFAHVATTNDSSDSSKENRIPREEEEKLAQNMQKSNDDEERQVLAFGPLTFEATQRHSSSVTPVTDMLLDDTGDNVTYEEEMANNENTVHL